MDLFNISIKCPYIFSNTKIMFFFFGKLLILNVRFNVKYNLKIIQKQKARLIKISQYNYVLMIMNT